MIYPTLLFHSIVAATIFVVLLTIRHIYKTWFSYWKEKDVPYLQPTIPFGNATKFFMGKQHFAEIFKDAYEEIRKLGWKYGGMYYCGKPVFIPVDNELIKKMLVSDFIHFTNHGLYIEENNEPFSGHIFNMENYKWKNLRAKLPAAFTASKMRRNVVIMNETSKVLIDVLDAHAEKGSVDIKNVLTSFTTDVVTACVFGMESNTLKSENKELLVQARSFFDKQFSRTNNTLVILIPRHILTMFKFKLFTKSSNKYFSRMFKQIKEHRETENVKRNDLTDLLLDLCDKTKEHPDYSGNGTMEPLTFNEFAAQMYVFFEAGFETTSSAQTFALYELAANQHIQAKLRTDIDKALQKHDGKVTYDAVNDMTYLDMVIDETLRKYPVFPILPRACTRNYTIPDTNITIEKNSFVMITNLGIHYDPEYYPDPMKFEPERFTAENKAKRPYCSYVPFGEGPRICVGKRFGIWQTKIGLINIIRKYHVKLSEKMQLPFSFDPSGTILNAKGKVWLDLEKIN